VPLDAGADPGDHPLRTRHRGALDRGKASLVAPVAGVSRAVVAPLSVLVRSDRLPAVQAVGVGLAVLGVALAGAGG